jgi:hypothetical protein
MCRGELVRAGASQNVALILFSSSVYTACIAHVGALPVENMAAIVHRWFRLVHHYPNHFSIVLRDGILPNRLLRWWASRASMGAKSAATCQPEKQVINASHNRPRSVASRKPISQWAPDR